MAIQEFMDHLGWVSQPRNAVAYAPYLSPRKRVPAYKSVSIILEQKGEVSNATIG
jgi:hypothetical protein